MFKKTWTVQSPALMDYLAEVVPGFRGNSNHYHPGWDYSGGQNTYHRTYELEYMLSDEYVDEVFDYDGESFGPTADLVRVNGWLDAINRDNTTSEFIEVRDFQPSLDVLFWWLVRYKGLELPSTDITVLHWW